MVKRRSYDFSKCSFFETPSTSFPSDPNILLRSCSQKVLSLCSTIKGKGKVVPVPFLNWAPHHGGVLGEGRYNSTHSWPRH